jgi:hypothetical protein
VGSNQNPTNLFWDFNKVNKVQSQMTTLQNPQFSLLKTKENNKAISKEKSNFGKPSIWRRKTKDQVRAKKPILL